MISAFRDSWALLLGVALMMLGNGLQGPALVVSADRAGMSTLMTGVIMAGYYAGYFFGALAAPDILSNVGHIRVFAAFASIASITTLFFPIFPDPILWLLLRFLTGFSFVVLYVVVESWLNDAATNKTRGQLLSIYMVITYAGVASSQFFLNLGSDEDRYILFVITSALVSLSLVPMSLTAGRAPNFEAPKPVSLKRLWRISPLGVVAALNSGVFTSALSGAGALFALKAGMATSDIALFLSVTYLGGLCFQYLVGLVSDHVDRRTVMVSLFFSAAAAAGGCFYLLTPEAPYSFLLATFVFGGLALPVYSMSIAHTNDNLESVEIISAAASLLRVSGVGTLIGPFLATVLMDYFGASHFFTFVVGLMLLTGFFGLYRMARRAAPASENQGQFVSIPGNSPVVVDLSPEYKDQELRKGRREGQGTGAAFQETETADKEGIPLSDRV